MNCFFITHRNIIERKDDEEEKVTIIDLLLGSSLSSGVNMVFLKIASMYMDLQLLSHVFRIFID